MESQSNMLEVRPWLQVEAAGITAFVPDQYLMQNVAFNLNTYGLVRVQVAPGQYEAAKSLLPAAPKA